MADQLLTIAQAAELLGLSTQRIYQLDHELEPVISSRGTQKLRRYRPEIIERSRASRAWRGGALTPEMLGAASAPCAFCGGAFDGTPRLTMVDAGAGGTPGNLLPCCALCDALKDKLDALPFLEHVLAIAKRQS